VSPIIVWTTIVWPTTISSMPPTSPQKHAPTRRFDSPEQEAFLSLWRTYDRLRAFEDELFARFDLTPQQYNALRLLRAEHPDPVATLALADRLRPRPPDPTPPPPPAPHPGAITPALE